MATRGQTAGAVLGLAASHAPDRGFRLGLACAAALHVAILLGLIGTATRQLGEPDGSLDAVNVDLIDSAQFAAQSAAPLFTGHTLTDPVPTPTPVPEQTPPTESRLPPKQSEAALTEKSLEQERPDLFALPDPTGKRAPTDRATKNKAQQQQSGFDLTVPKKLLDSPMSFQGTSAAVTRPSDVTKSGENDDFGRGVIKALRVTMPAPNGSTGRVTIRFLLSPTGNIAEIRLVSGAGDPQLDQAVIFAARQANFPLPPKNATVSDRTFLVTYIYR